MSLQSLKTIVQSNLDLKAHTNLKMGGGHFGNKMADVERDPEMNTKNLKMLS